MTRVLSEQRRRKKRSFQHSEPYVLRPAAHDLIQDVI